MIDSLALSKAGVASTVAFRVANLSRDVAESRYESVGQAPQESGKILKQSGSYSGRPKFMIINVSQAFFQALFLLGQFGISENSSDERGCLGVDYQHNF